MHFSDTKEKSSSIDTSNLDINFSDFANFLVIINQLLQMIIISDKLKIILYTCYLLFISNIEFS